MEIIDTHVHYMEPPSAERPHDPNWPLPEPVHSVEQVLADAKEAGVTQVVQVTRGTMGSDNRYSFECAERFPKQITGVFARMEPTGADMPLRLAELRAHPHFLGVRLTLLKPPTLTWLHDGAIEAFLDEAGNQNVPVAIYAPHQAKALGDIAGRHPKTKLLVDHMALRYTDEDPFAAWSESLDLADVPNVWIKITYFPLVSHDGYPFKRAQVRFKEMFERFGADRLIWGANYPPVKRVACTYKQAVDFVRVECDFLSESDKVKIFADTFLRVCGRKP